MAIGKPTAPAPKRQSPIASFLKQQALERLQARNAKGSGFYPDINTQVTKTLTSPKAVAWNNWLENTGNTLGRKKDDIEINGDIVTVKIPGYKNLVFNPAEYKIGGQQWGSNDKKDQEKGSGNKFSKEDFEKLIEFLGGNNSKGYWRAGVNAVSFLRDILGLETGRFYWSSVRSGNDSAWGLDLSEGVVFVGGSSQGSSYSAIVSQN